MNETSTAIPILVDLWFTVVKLLGRRPVQLQLLFGLSAILAAWLISEAIVQVWDQRRWWRLQESTHPEPRVHQTSDASSSSTAIPLTIWEEKSGFSPLVYAKYRRSVAADLRAIWGRAYRARH